MRGGGFVEMIISFVKCVKRCWKKKNIYPPFCNLERTKKERKMGDVKNVLKILLYFVGFASDEGK